jgi:bifunctional DNA-binding transcriptional regulator/antitoxin component of YhaV-PrlF toxin-antitoxin module
MPSVTVIVRSKTGLVVPPSVQRKAGIKAGDRLEFKASRGLITIATKSNGAEDKYTSDQRRMVDREIARGLEDIKRGRVHGPFTASEAAKFITAELKTRTRKRKPK